MTWITRYLRGKAVFVKANPDGSLPANEKGLVPITYQKSETAKVYNARASNLLLEPSEESRKKVKKKAAPSQRSNRPALYEAYTDGACSGNPGPAGAGVFLTTPKQQIKIAEPLGNGTNNIAELQAIAIALQVIPIEDREKAINIYTDSTYSIGVLTQGWKAKANKELIAEIKALLQDFSDVQFIKVKGHSGDPGNEMADELARMGSAGEALKQSIDR